MEVRTKITMVDEEGEKFFGEGPYRLMLLIEETGSLRAAALKMGMAYTKALKIMSRAEEVLGYELTVKQTGGHAGGGSKLTPQGKEWVERYGKYREACIAANRKLYLEFFS